MPMVYDRDIEFVKPTTHHMTTCVEKHKVRCEGN